MHSVFWYSQGHWWQDYHILRTQLFATTNDRLSWVRPGSAAAPKSARILLFLDDFVCLQREQTTTFPNSNMPGVIFVYAACRMQWETKQAYSRHTPKLVILCEVYHYVEKQLDTSHFQNHHSNSFCSANTFGSTTWMLLKLNFALLLRGDTAHF